MTIRKAIPDDAARVLEILEDAKAALRQNGVDQWQNGYPNDESVRSDIDAGICHVLEISGEIAATAAVYVGNEPTYNDIMDGAWQTDSRTYGIIHRIAVDERFKNTGAATRFVAFCEEISRLAGVSSLRCDTHRDNKIMQRMLQKNGYALCGTILLEDGSERLGFEKILS